MSDNLSRNGSAAKVAPRLQLSIEERFATMTLNAPPLNIFDFELIREFRSALKILRKNRITVALLQSAAPRAFSAGVDVKIHTPEEAPRMLRRFHNLIRAIDKGDTVFIALVDGACLGGGFELALACDFVFSTRRSEFGFPEIDLGCFPPVAVALLPRLSPAAAADLVLTGRRFDAVEAHRLGLIHHASDDAAVVVKRLTQTLLDKSAHALAQARRGLRLSSGSLSGALARTERLYERKIVPSLDAEEGVSAFIEKRYPVWRHR